MIIYIYNTMVLWFCLGLPLLGCSRLTELPGVGHAFRAEHAEASRGSGEVEELNVAFAKLVYVYNVM